MDLQALHEAREFLRTWPMDGEVNIVGNRLADEVERQAARIAALEAALREAREWVPVPPAAKILATGNLLQAHTTFAKIDAALEQPVGGGS